MVKLIISFFILAVMISGFQESSAGYPVWVCFVKPERSVALYNVPFWGFDSLKNECVKFTKHISHGNSFKTKAECETYCPSRTQEDHEVTTTVSSVFQESSSVQSQASVCFVKPERSVALYNVPFWGFDSLKNECVKFTKHISHGNSFKTKAECEKSCPPKKFTQEDHEVTTKFPAVLPELSVGYPVWVCFVKPERSVALYNIPFWGFDSLKNECVKFTKHISHGNSFKTKAECEKSCPPKTQEDCEVTTTVSSVFQESSSVQSEASVCFVKPERSVALYNVPFWGFDSLKNECVKFTKHISHGNSFKTKAECEKSCPPKKFTQEDHEVTTKFPAVLPELSVGYPVWVCFVKPERSVALYNIPFWGFDSLKNECVKFTKHISHGNSFKTKAECEKSCPPKRLTQEVQEVTTKFPDGFQKLSAEYPSKRD